MSDLEFRPSHKFFRVTISFIKFMKNSNSDMISLHINNNSPYKITLPPGLLGYCETNGTNSPTKEVAYRVNNVLQLLDIRQSTIRDEKLSINNIICNDYFTKKPYFKPSFHLIKIHVRTTKIFNNVQFSTLSDKTKRI